MAVQLKTALIQSLLLLIPVASVEAGPLYDWVYGTPSQYTANYRGYPGSYTANYFPGGFSNTIPGSAAAEPRYYQSVAPPVVAQPPAAYVPPALPPAAAPTYAPGPAYAPGPTYAPSGGCNSCQSQTYNYRPPAYRTTTMRVPVTVYRPVAALDPNTGTPVTSYQPCTTYRVQTRRVARPVWTFPIWNWLFGPRQPVYTQPPVVANYGVCSVDPHPEAPLYGGGYTTVGPSTTSVIQPNQSSWQPAAGSVSPAAPYVPAPQYAPQGMPPAAGGYQPMGSPMQGGAAEPAATQPRLRIPLDSETNGIEGETDLNGANGSSLYRAPTRRPHYPQPAVPVAGQSNAQRDPLTEPPKARLRLVPDPDAHKSQPGEIQAPALINPNDRTARHAPVRRSWGVVPASWPIDEQHKTRAKVAVDHRQPPAPAAAPAAAEAGTQWDNSGWQPARRGW